MYVFTSERLGFRNWQDTDIEPMAAINADPEVMRYFPALQDQDQTKAFIGRMQDMYADKGFCYFAVDLLESSEFIGFIGLSIPKYDAHFTPCIDIGWRLAKRFWRKGYATEGARACLKYGFETLQLNEIVATCPAINTPSENVMIKAGMTFSGLFLHPLLGNAPHLQQCKLYKISR